VEDQPGMRLSAATSDQRRVPPLLAGLCLGGLAAVNGPAIADKIDAASIPPGAVYVCAAGTGKDRAIAAIELEDKVAALCRRHTEMGPCQNARNACRRSGGRVYAADGNEITQADEAEYDKKVMRLRLGP
jgi:hypothetical protein